MGLNAVLGQLEQSGEIARIRKNRYVLPSEADLVTGTLHVHQAGYAFLSLEKPGEQDLFISAENTGTAMHGDKVVAYIAGHLTRRYDCDGEVQYLFVVPPSRRSGVATRLLRLLACWFADHEATRICAGVDPGSPAARPFYTRHGAIPLNQHWVVWSDIRTLLAQP